MKSTAKILDFQVSQKVKKKAGGNSPSKDKGLAFGKFLTDETMKKLSARFSEPVDERGYRDRALFLVMASTGLRAKEIVNLKFSDAVQTPHGKTAFRYTRKGGKEYYTIPSKAALEAVKAYHQAVSEESDHFFLTLPTNRLAKRQAMTTKTLRLIINAWKSKRADGLKATPHSLRHTVGQRVFEKAGSIAVQKVLGHSTPITAQKFYTAPYFDGTDYLQW